MSCDNIQGNGEVAHKMIGAFAPLKDPELARWIEEHVSFPNSMVDRITPVTTDHDRPADGEVRRRRRLARRVRAVHPVGARGPLLAGRPPFDEAGVQLVPDVTPYELMKLRLLNASHQALCYLGYLAGYRYAHEVCSDPLFTDFLLGYMDDGRRRPSSRCRGSTSTTYKHQLIERFANPEIKDTLARLCAESSDRIPKWLLPVVRAPAANGETITPVGARRRRLGAVRRGRRRGRGADRHRGPPQRPADGTRPAAGRRPAGVPADPDLFGDLVDDERFTSEYVAALDSLHAQGARGRSRPGRR